jgi:hypothetical protein
MRSGSLIQLSGRNSRRPKDRIVAAGKSVCLDKQFRLQRRSIPRVGRDEMMQLIIPARSQPLRHRLNTLPLARSDQTRNVQRTHPLSRLMAQTVQEGFKPALEIVVPIQNLGRHDRLSNSRSAMNHQTTDSGIPLPPF